MGRAPCCEKNGVKKGPWTPEEDKLLIEYIHKNGCGNWRTVPNNAGLQRCGKSCRLRWTNYLRPDIKRGRFSFQEEEAIIQLHTILGNRWSAIAARLPGRTDNEIKNYWNTRIIKRLMRMGIDPVTHRFRPDLLELASITNSSNPTSSPQSTLSRLLRMQASTNYPEIMRLASSPIQNHQINHGQVQAQQLVQMQTPFQDFTIPPNCLDHHQLMHFGGVECFPQNLSGFGSELLAENYGLAAATCGYYGSGQPVVDPGSSMDSCTFQSDSSSGLGFEQSLLSYISIPLSSPTTLQF